MQKLAKLPLHPAIIFIYICNILIIVYPVYTSQKIILGSFFNAVLPTIAAITCFVASQQTHADIPADKKFWLYCGFACLCVSAGSFVLFYYDITLGRHPVPSAADAGFLLFDFVLGYGIYSYGRAKHNNFIDKMLLLDLLILAITCFCIYWFFVLASFQPAQYTALWKKIVITAYPVLDIILIWFAFGNMSGSNNHGIIPIKLFLASLILCLIYDSIYMYEMIYNIYYSGSILDFIWVTMFLALSLAAAIYNGDLQIHHPRNQNNNLQTKQRPFFQSAATLFAVLCPLCVIPTLLLISCLTYVSSSQMHGLIYASFAVSIAILIRLITILKENNKRFICDQTETEILKALLNHKRIVEQNKDLIHIAQDIFKIINRLVGPAQCLLFLRNESNADFSLYHAYGVNKEDLQKIKSLTFNKDTRHFISTLLNSKTNIYTDASSIYNTAYLDKPAYIYPLLDDIDTIGFTVLIPDNKHPIGEHTANIITFICSQITIIIKNIKTLHNFEQQAVTDGLTGLNNYRYFQEQLQARLACPDKAKESLSLLMFDIDNFKHYNDCFGHLCGDKILREFADILRNNLRNADAIVRYGGDEFVVIFNGLSEEQSFQIAERIRKTVEQHSFLINNKQTGTLTVSIGVAYYHEVNISKDELVAQADAALYCAKRTERNIVVSYK